MEPPKTNVTPDLAQPLAKVAGGKEAEVSGGLLEKSRQSNDTVLQELETRLDGLSQSEADSRLKKYVPMRSSEKTPVQVMLLLGNFKNPLVILLLAAILVRYVTLTQVVKTWFIRRFGD